MHFHRKIPNDFAFTQLRSNRESRWCNAVKKQRSSSVVDAKIDFVRLIYRNTLANDHDARGSVCDLMHTAKKIFA